MPTSQTALDLKAALIAAFPPGLDKMWNWDHPLGPGPFQEAVGQLLDVAGVQRIEQLRLELQPSTASESLPEWESALDLRGSRTASTGSTKKRQVQLLSRLREWGSATTLECIRSIIGPLLDYADPSQLVILETDRDTLRAAHTYSWAGSVPFSTTIGAVPILVPDDALVSPAGAQLDMTITYTGSLANVGVNLFSPDGTYATIAPSLGQIIGDTTPATGTYRLYFRSLAGHPVGGLWRFEIACNTGVGTLTAARLFVEGLGYDSMHREGLGAAKFMWAAVADPALMGPDADLQAAARAVQRINYATRRGFLVRKPLFGTLGAIPDDPGTIPDACVPG